MTELRRFIEEQERLGQVERVTEPLSTSGSAARVTTERQGRIVILENIDGHDAAVVSGVAGSRSLLAAAIGAAPAEAIALLAQKMETRGHVVKTAEAPFLDNAINDPDLSAHVPLLRYDPGSEQPYTSASIVVARSERHGQNLSFHRMMYLGSNRFSVRIVPRHLKMILDEAGGRARVAVIFGVHPAICLAAATSGNPGFDELELAASLLGGQLEAYDLDGLLVPAAAEIVFDGVIDANELAQEGPFVDLTGTLDGMRQQPVLTVNRLYYRSKPLYHTIVPGGQEHRLLMGTPQEPRILRAVENAFPRISGVSLSSGGCNWLHAVVALARPRLGQARNVAMAALGAHPSLKRVVVVDDDVDIHDAEQVEWAIATRVQPADDVVIIPGARGSSLDPSRHVESSTTSKWIIDATIPEGRERSEFVLAEPGGTK